MSKAALACRMPAPECWSKPAGPISFAVFRRQDANLVLGQRGLALLEQGDDSGRDRRGGRRAVVALEVAGEVGDGAEVRLVRRQRRRALAAVADELLVLVHRADRDHPLVAVRAPDAAPRSGIAAATPGRAGFAAVAGGEQHHDAFVDRFDDLAGKGVIGVGRVVRSPVLLEHAPAVGEDVRRAVDAMLVDRPLEGLQRVGQGVAVGDAQVVELRLRRHAEHVGAAHHAVVAPGHGGGSPAVHRPAADHAIERRAALAVADRASGSADAAVHDADDHRFAPNAGRPELIDAEVGADVRQRALRRAGIAVADADGAGAEGGGELERLLRPAGRSPDRLGRIVGDRERGDPAVAPNSDHRRVRLELLPALGVDRRAHHHRALAFAGCPRARAPVVGATLHRHRREGRIDGEARNVRAAGQRLGLAFRRNPQLDEHPVTVQAGACRLLPHTGLRHVARRLPRRRFAASLGARRRHVGARTRHLLLPRDHLSRRHRGRHIGGHAL